MDSARNGHGEGTRRSVRGGGAGRSDRARAPAGVLHRGAAQGGHEDLAELEELLRTAGVAVVGELIQRREQPHPDTYLGAGKLAEAQGAARGGRRQPDRLRRRAERAPGAQPRAGAGPAGGRPHDRDPRHLRRARRHRRGQAPGRARAARVQPRAHARVCGATSSASAAGSARGARARPRSRPTAAWRATASRRCAGASST